MAMGDDFRSSRKTLSRIHSNNLQIRKCKHKIFYMAKKKNSLTENYGDRIRFAAEELEEAIA